MRTLSYVRAATFGSGRNAWPEQVQTSCGGPACGQVQKIVALGHENSPAPRARQDDEKRDPVRRDGHAVRIFEMPCGFFTVFADFPTVVRIFRRSCGFSDGRADFQRAVRILDGVCGFSASRADFLHAVRIVCGPKPAGNGLFRAKSRRFRVCPAENPHDESAQVFKNPHSPLKIRTAVVLRRGPRVVPLRIA